MIQTIPARRILSAAAARQPSVAVMAADSSGPVQFIGMALLITGITLSVLAWRHDLKRLRIAARLPQAAPSRVAPELHLLAALLTSGGSTILSRWYIGLAVLVLHATVAFAMPRLLERIARRAA